VFEFGVIPLSALLKNERLGTIRLLPELRPGLFVLLSIALLGVSPTAAAASADTETSAPSV